MSYQVLARKWRPKSFQDLVGQEHVLRVLMNALTQKRLHHAYLLAGTRGVGKTTLARILAKCLNCEVDITPTPCEKCKACLAINSGQFLDLYEIDAASRTKVEDTRELLENVAYPPVQGRYKIYLIDEVHMLSTHSFNALLKTLEEPPPQVMFLFATTEPKKLPVTILSRCLQFHLKHLTPEQIARQLQFICGQEGIESEEAALQKLAQAADGSLRDALSLLDQAIVYCDKTLKDSEITQMLGYATQDEVLALLQALAARDGANLLQVLKGLQTRSPNYHQVLAELLSFLHQLAVAQVVPGYPLSSAAQTLSTTLSPEEVQLYYQIALIGQKDLPWAPTPAQGFEMLALRMLAFRPAAHAKELPQAKTAPNKAAAKVAPPPTAKPVAQALEIKELKQEIKEIKASLTSTAYVPGTPLPTWREMVAKFELTGMAQALALNCAINKITDHKFELVIEAGFKPMIHPRLVERIEAALTRFLNRPTQISIEITTDPVSSPAKELEAQTQTRKAEVVASLDNEAGVQKIKSLFNATLDTQSVEVGSD